MPLPPKPPTPSPPPQPPQDIPPAAEQAANLVGWGGWLAFWIQLVAAAVAGVMIVVAVVSRTMDDERVIWVGLSILFAIISLVTLCVSTYLAFRLTRMARRLALPQLTPTPSPQAVTQRITLTLYVSTAGLAVGLLGTEISALSLLAKTLAHPQGAALYAPQSTLRVLDVLVILINSGLALAHFCGQATSYWLLRHKW
jgi:hypothetical protein